MTINISKEFVLAGNATFTVSKAGGDHYTFKVTHPKKLEDKPLWFVSLLTGRDNESSFTYLGTMNGNLEFRLTAKSKMLPDSIPVKAIIWALARVNDRNIPDGWAIQHEGRCGRCGRKLTVPESIDSGIGPECAKKYAFT